MLNRNQQHLKLRHAYGTSMVEVLVALVVIGVGMLGIASLYVVTLQAKTTSQSRIQAVNLANDMAERIRANPTATYAIATSVSAATPTVTCFESASSAATPCTGPQMAAADLFQWSNMVTSTLPGNVTRSITAIGSLPTTYTITLNWSEPTAGSLSYALQVQI